MNNEMIKHFLKNHPSSGNLYTYNQLKATLWKQSGEQTDDRFENFVNWLNELEQQGYLKPFKKDRRAGTVPDCWLTYRVKEVKPTIQTDVEMFFRQHHSWLQTGQSFYSKHTDLFLKDKLKLEQLHQQLIALGERLEEPQTLNQRAFEIFQHEKLLQPTVPSGLSEEEQQWRVIVSERLKWTSQLEKLNIEEANTLPLVFEIHRQPQTNRILIVENYDPFWLLVNHYRHHRMECPYDAFVWGHGKLIESSFRYLTEDYYEGVFQHQTLYYDYAGDLDIEGIQIYRRLIRRYPNHQIQYVKGYADALIRKAEQMPTLLGLPYRMTTQVWQSQWQNEWLEEPHHLDFLGKKPQESLTWLSVGGLLPQERLTKQDWMVLLETGTGKSE